MAKLVRRVNQKRGYQCSICGEKKDSFYVCCGHPMIDLKTNWDLLDWDILDWKKKASLKKG
jgi:hypothetical protein